MAYLSSFGLYCAKNVSNVFKRISIREYCTTTKELTDSIKTEDADLPVELENPYVKEKPKCILCKYNIEPDYKNVRLLSQFISRYTGRIFPRHITGICHRKHLKLTQEVKKAVKAHLMPKQYKFPVFFEDPALYNLRNLSKPRRII